MIGAFVFLKSNTGCHGDQALGAAVPKRRCLCFRGALELCPDMSTVNGDFKLMMSCRTGRNDTDCQAWNTKVRVLFIPMEIRHLLRKTVPKQLVDSSS
ncbi:hypothetical protein CEXT_23321 [Caerostris extrusa]|uniref:Uncharacterized protein n=1 Tax=Caerostris extrusa TaxID=172846 RepID=A0AAV4XQ98_CAEEX|nr:hypothetical protein CEXT_23321 [Caerostris extrusa]